MNYLSVRSFLKAVFFFAVFLFSAAGSSAADGHEIKLKINGLHDTLVYIGFYYNDKQMLQDSVMLDHSGSGVLKGKEKLIPGIYIVVLPNKSFFEMLVNDQKFSIETDTVGSEYYAHMKVTGSQDNLMFRDYQAFMTKITLSMNDLSKRKDKNKDNKDSTTAINERISVLNKEVQSYRKKLMDNNDPNLFLPAIIRALWEPEVPDAKKADGTQDAEFRFAYYKKHYFDKFDFCDDRLLRTPLFYAKIMQYLKNLIVPDPDSMSIATDTIINRAKCNKEVYKYCVATLTNYFEMSNIMGFDKVFVYLCDKYYLTREPVNNDSAMLAAIRKRVEEIRPNLIGIPAHDMVLEDSNGIDHRLYDVKAKYTILVFFDPTCSHCKAEIPKVAALYDSVKSNGVEVYAVGIEADLAIWRQFIVENKLKWINVTDMYNRSDFRSYYDTYLIPVIYLLDENKKILAKRLNTETLREMLKHLTEEKKSKP